MHSLRIVLMVILLIVSIAMTVVVLMQEGKSASLGAISGMADSYWGKNKGRSMEGKLVKWTAILGGLFFILSLILNLKFF